MGEVKGHSSNLLLLRRTFEGRRPFTALEACERLNLSPSGFLRLVTWAIEHGHLERVGRGRSSRYRILHGAAAA
jgi:hypothetical protein